MAHEREVIEDAEAALPEPSLRPWWVSLVAGNRDLFQGAALFEDSGVNPRIFFFLFAKKNPQEACFMEVREVSLLWPGCGGILPNDVQVVQGTRKEFAFLDPLRVVSDTEVPFSEEAPIFVYEGLRFQGDRLVASHEPRPFEDFVRFHPRRPAPAPRAATGPKGKVAATAQDKILEECPWLTKEDLQEPRPKQRKAQQNTQARRAGPKQHAAPSEASGDDEASVASPCSEEVPPEIEVDVSRELAFFRETLALPEDDSEPYFMLRMRGGDGTFLNKAKLSDCVQVTPRGSEPRYWAQAFGFPASESPAFGLYGRDNALRLAREFSRRANFFASLYFESVDDDFVYSQAHLEACGDDLEFVNWMCSSDVEDVLFSKGQEIRQLVPHVP